MKKILITIVVLLLFTFLFKGNQKLIIPNDAIRFRVIASSDSEYDQQVKQLVTISLSKEIQNSLKGASNIDDARTILKLNIPKFKNVVNNTLTENNINEKFTIDYGNHYFPEKVYNGVSYKDGEYESLVVSLGNASGKNWWCVLFPPLCLLEAEETKEEDVEYKFFLKDLFEDLFG